VLCDAAAAFKVGTDAIALKVKHEFAAKVKARTKNITPAKAEPAKLKKT
jgi:ParB family chromosome partitioning protein